MQPNGSVRVYLVKWILLCVKDSLEGLCAMLIYDIPLPVSCLVRDWRNAAHWWTAPHRA